ncbi:MAG: ABC transporter permease subunit [Acidilobus sp.]
MILLRLVALAVLATLATTGRVFLTIALSIVTGWLFGYLALKSKTFESAYVSISGVLESVPVISFFPVALIFFVRVIGGYLGVELAVDFLVFTAVVWNIWMGIYQAFKTIPLQMVEVVENLNYGFLSKMAKLYIPYSIPRIAANLLPSFADAYFYITVSEVFSIGATSYQVFGIGSLLDQLTSRGLYNYVYISLAILFAVIASFVMILRRVAVWAVAKYGVESPLTPRRRGPGRWRSVSRFYTITTSRLRLIRSVGGRVIAGPLYSTLPLRRVVERQVEVSERTLNLALKATGLALLALIVFGALHVIISVPMSMWRSLASQTGSILLGLAYDYARVAVITGISFIIAIFVGYYLATHRRAEAITVPLIQAFSAMPAPAYFPLLFAATYAFVARVSGPLTNEIYVVFLGFISTFYYIFYSYWLGVKAIPLEVIELMENLNMSFFAKLRKVIIPGTLPYIVTGLTSTIDSAWGGLMIGEYWPNIVGDRGLQVTHGILKIIDVATAEGNIALAAYASLIFGLIVVLFSLGFTRHLMEVSRRRYVIEESIFAA